MGVDGEKVGVLTIKEALERAEQAGEDLVEIAPQAEPPVCRIMDYGKYRFEQNKKSALQRKKVKQVQTKEIKMRPVTEEGDYQVKLRSAARFLEENDKVKFTIRFRGREISYQDQGLALLNRVAADLGDSIIVEQHPKSEGRQLAMVVGPKKKK